MRSKLKIEQTIFSEANVMVPKRVLRIEAKKSAQRRGNYGS